ncbi:MAG: hypothetical protein IJG57_01925 [Firmicutes bacterium]|jgi:hypothetical protein|nr:hypothetical protein [Bacillota bacterium]
MNTKSLREMNREELFCVLTGSGGTIEKAQLQTILEEVMERRGIRHMDEIGPEVHLEELVREYYEGKE